MTQSDDINALRTWLNSQIIGQHHLVDRLLIALLANGHLLVEGAPGLAKTRAVKSLAQAIEGSFHRVQFTPDLLPGDVTGTDIYRPEDGNFVFQQGPIFNNIVLADEINRAPAKVQSALLEAMAERQVSVGRNTYQLPELFLVMATQNPIEQEGTYPLPEAQLDRFLMHVTVNYPSPADEKLILHLSRDEDLAGSEAEATCHISQASVFKARQDILKLHLAEPVEDYIVQLVVATRNASEYDETLGALIEFGASPRGTIGLERCARAHAWLQGKDFVSPDNVRAVAHDVLSHRIILSFEAEANGVDSKQVIDRLLASVPVA